MRKDKIFIIVTFAILVAWAAYMQFLPATTTAPTSGILSTMPSMAGEFRGIWIPLHNGEEDHPYEKYIDEVSVTGANTVCFVVTAYMENGSSSNIYIEQRKTPSASHLKKLIKYAHEKKMRVLLMPIVLMTSPRDGEWRGTIKPSNWTQWWQDYESYIMHHAYIAAETGVEIFSVGSELVSTENETEKWRAIIAKVRKSYTGLLTYSSNWDHYEVVKFWDDLDLIGMTTYYDLTGGKEPTVERLMESWKPIKEKLLTWQATIKRPLLFTEVGWPNQETCAQYPWDYYRATDKPKPEYQANCFEAFFQTWFAEPALAGILIWEWQSYPGQDTSPEKDTSYIPKDKPAMEIISRYFRMPSLNATSTSAPSSAPAETK